MVPDARLIHEVVVVNPALGTDPYGNTSFDYGPTASRTVLRGWLQQSARDEDFTAGGRASDVERWLLITNEAGISDKARVEWTGPRGPVVFEVDGPPEPVYSGLSQGYHHTETRLRAIKG